MVGMSKRSPHIVYILSDEHRGQAMGHMGDANLRTPVMDRMAEEGASIARAYANCPICTPSRGSIFSGRHAHAGPVPNFFDVFKPTSPSTATILHEGGYHSAYFGKWHCGIVRDQTPEAIKDDPRFKGGSRQRTPEHLRGGFRDWFGFENLNQHFNSSIYRGDEELPTPVEGYETDGLTDMAIKYLESYDRDEPLFLVLSVTPPHFPLIVPEKWKRWNPADLSVPPNFDESAEMRENLANYYAMIENLDWNMGRLMDALQRLEKFSGNTLSVYFSDHGDFMGSHGLANRKEHPHEESIRIPAIFHWPGHIPARQTIDPGLFGLVDMLPTTLGLAGVDIPPHNQGTDFSPALRGEDFTGPEDQLIEMVGNPRWNLDFQDWRGVVGRQWKYTCYDTGRELLFDVENDPYETNNLCAQRPEVRNRMRQRLLELLAETREPYFDVLIEHGAPCAWPVKDVGPTGPRRMICPGMEDETVFLTEPGQGRREIAPGMDE